MKHVLLSCLVCSWTIFTISCMNSPQERLRTYIQEQSLPSLPHQVLERPDQGKSSCVTCCVSLDSSSSSVDFNELVFHPVRKPLPQANQSLLWAIFNKKNDTVVNCIASVPIGMINVPDKRGWTPLHYAVHDRYAWAVIKLLERDDIERDCVTDSGLTPTTILKLMHLNNCHKGTDDCTYLIDQLAIDPDFVDSLLEVNSHEE